MERKSSNLDKLIENAFGFIQKHLSYVFFLFILCMVYIWNNQLSQSLITSMNKKAKELKEMRWDYLTIQSDLMYKGKLSQVEKTANEIGLYEITNPHHKLTLKSKEYKEQEYHTD